MATKVFISWSGELSKKLGEAVRNWLPSTLQFVKPYFSPDDIEKGAKWNSEIAKELESSNIGVICLTRDNTEKPWILFEAGALSKTIEKSRVCTLLFDVDPAEVKGPLTSFQGTRFNKDDFKRLVGTINSVGGESRLEVSVLETVFDMWWPKLETQITEILKSHEKVSRKEKRSDRDMLEEVLELTRMNSGRNSRAPRLNPAAILDLIENLDELTFVLSHQHGELGLDLLRRLERPMRHLCAEAGIPEVYERFSARRRSRSEPSIAAAIVENVMATEKVKSM